MTHEKRKEHREGVRTDFCEHKRTGLCHKGNDDTAGIKYRQVNRAFSSKYIERERESERGVLVALSLPLTVEWGNGEK